MYLEISARRTGKTVRLVKAVKEHLENGNTAIVIVPELRWAKFMELPQKEPNLFILSDYDLKKAVPNKLKGIRFNKPRWFFDEFDFMENIRNVPAHFVDDEYYVTTPRFVRKISEMSQEEIETDALLSLLKRNKDQYVAYTFDKKHFRLRCWEHF